MVNKDVYVYSVKTYNVLNIMLGNLIIPQTGELVPIVAED